MFGTGNNAHSLFSAIQQFAGGGPVMGGDRAGDTRFTPSKAKPKKSRFSRFVHYSLGDTLRDIDDAQSHLTGIHAKTALKTYADPLRKDYWKQLGGSGKSILSPSQTREKERFADGVKSFHGVGSGLAYNAAGGWSTRGALSRRSAAKHAYFGSDSVVFGIKPQSKKISLRDRIKAEENIKGAADTIGSMPKRMASTPLTKSDKAKLRAAAPEGLFADPGMASTPEELAARKAALARKRAEIGMHTKHAEIYDYIGVKQLTPQELEELDKRIAQTEEYKGPANQMPDHERSRRNADLAARRLLDKRQRTAVEMNAANAERYRQKRRLAAQAILNDARKIAEQGNIFLDNWNSTYYAGYEETAADFAGGYLYHLRAAQKRIDENLHTVGVNDRRLGTLENAKLPTGPMPQGKKPPAKAIPNTAGAMKAMRDAKEAKRQAKLAKGAAIVTGTGKPAGQAIGEVTIAGQIRRAQDALLKRGEGKAAHDLYLKYKDNPRQLLASYEAMLLSVGVSSKRLPQILGRLAREETGTLDLGMMFHGTSAPFKLKDIDWGKFTSGIVGPGFYTTPEYFTAKRYSQSRRGVLAGGPYNPTVQQYEMDADRMFNMTSVLSKDDLSAVIHMLNAIGGDPKMIAGMSMNPQRFGRAYGSNVYSALYSQLGSKTAVNEFLSKGGFDVIKYDQGRTHGTNEGHAFNVLRRGIPKMRQFGAGGWVPGTGQGDKVPAFLTPGEFVVSRPMMNSLTNGKGGGNTTSTSNDIHVTVQASNPTEKSILDALKPVLFSLRHSR